MTGRVNPATDRYGFGRVFGRGVVINPDTGRRSGKKRIVRLLCHPHEGGCGTVYETSTSNLLRGTRSCGCLQQEIAARHAAARNRQNASHGLHRHPLYQTWYQILDRCENPADGAYRWYGGRGIAVCAEWHDPARFIADIEASIGPRPPGRFPSGRPLYSLNRVDNDGPYALWNVEWADWVAQWRNQRRM